MRRLALLVIVLLAGCADGGVGSRDCTGDWFLIGERDGRMNVGSQAERYAARCGVPVDGARYEEGYRKGMSERPHVPSF